MMVATPWNQQPKPRPFYKIGQKKNKRKRNETYSKHPFSGACKLLVSRRVGVFFQNLNFVWAELEADSTSTTRHPGIQASSTTRSKSLISTTFAIFPPQKMVVFLPKISEDGDPFSSSQRWGREPWNLVPREDSWATWRIIQLSFSG